MKKLTKEKKKRRRLKVVFVITSVCVIFSLFCISCFAYQHGVGYVPNVYVGSNTYLLHPIEGMSYVTRTASNYYLKDIPVGDSYFAYNSPGWNGFGNPLVMGAQSQVTYSNEVYTGIVNPDTINSLDHHIANLGDDYREYFTNGQIDAVRYQIFTNQQYSSAGQCYQRAIIDFADIYIPNLAVNTEFRLLTTPQLRMYRPATMGSAYYSLRCTVSGRSTLDGHVYSQNIGLSDVVDDDVDATVEYNGIQQNIYSLDLYSLIAKHTDTELESCPYWHITNLTFVLGKQHFNLDGMSLDIYGCSNIDIYLPSVRPYNPGKVTSDNTYDLKNPVDYDVNYIRTYNGEITFAGDDSSDLEISSVGSFIGDITRGFLDIYIIPGISLGGILFTCLAIGFVVVVLRYFAGG